MHSIDNNHFNWLSKYCPDPSDTCANEDSLWKRYLISVYAWHSCGALGFLSALSFSSRSPDQPYLKCN